LYLEIAIGTYITRSHYERATTTAPQSKAPSPDAITNELVKHLPEAVHALIYTLLQIMAKYYYTPKECYRSATYLLYKPNKKDPHYIAYYRPISLMNDILRLWISILASIGSPWAEAQEILSDIVDGFRRHRKIYDSLSTHIMMYEDVKMSRKHIYMAYSDFKGAFGGMNHRIRFHSMRGLGFRKCYIHTCEQFYKLSGTYYMTPRENIPTIPIHRGTLQEDTISLFLFAIFIELPLR